MFDDDAEGPKKHDSSSRAARLARAYREGFRSVLKKKAVIDSITCPFSVLDDPGMDRARAYDFGVADARAVLNGRRAVG